MNLKKAKIFEDDEDDEENPKLAGNKIWAINSGERPLTKNDSQPKETAQLNRVRLRRFPFG